MASFGNTSLGERPFVGISDEIVLWGGKHCAIKRIVIGGKIYECGEGPNTGNNILDAIAGWKDSLLNGYQSISVGGFSANYARCDSLEITNSDYLGAEYRAEFLAYPDEWFSDIVGILEPVDNINASVSKDGLLTVKRTASARAATDKGFDSVSTWIQSLNVDKPPDISKLGIGQLTVSAPKTLIETIDRINGSISVEATFVQNLDGNDDTVLKYTVDVQYDDKTGIYTATISGSLEGTIKTNIGNIRDKISAIGPFELANSVFSKISTQAVLTPSPSEINISENDETDTVNFSITYNTFPQNGQKKYFNFTIDYDHIKDITTVTVSGTVTFDSKISHLDRNDLIENIIKQYNFAALCEDEFYKNAQSTDNKLNINNPVSYSVTINRGSDISADVSVSYNNEDVLPSNDFISFDYDIEISASYNVNIPVQFLDGSAGIFNYKANKRGNGSIRGVAITKNLGMEEEVRSSALSLLDGAMSDFGRTDEIFTENNVIFTNVSDNGYSYEFDIRQEAILEI